MTRVLDPIFQAGLDNNAGAPIIRAVLLDGRDQVTTVPLYYKLDNLELTVRISPTIQGGALRAVKIIRGLKINGIEYTVDSGWFGLRNWRPLRKYVELICHSFTQDTSVIIDADTTSEDVIEAVVSAANPTANPVAYTNIVSWPDYIEWWRGIQFYPAGKQLILNKAESLASILKQKYLAQLCNIGDNVLTVIGSNYLYEEDYQHLFLVAKLIDYFVDQTEKSRNFLWRDENSTIHTSGSGHTIHNLGFVPSTVTPNLDGYESWKSFIVISPPDLSVAEGDTCFVEPSATLRFPLLGGPCHVVEIFDPSQPHSWIQEISNIEWAENTAGGALPSTIERVAAYTPLVTTGFDKNLDSSVNNLQALAEAVDELDFPPSSEGVTNGDSHDHNGGDGGQVAYSSLSGRPTLGSAADNAETDFAPASKGVSNGDSHDHNGGDGAQIAYSSLSGRPTLGSAADNAETDFAPASKGVTGGDVHNHFGGDGAQIAYATLSGLPTLDLPDDEMTRLKLRLAKLEIGLELLLGTSISDIVPDDDAIQNLEGS